MSNFDDDTFVEETPPEEASNRTFLIVAGASAVLFC